MISTYYTLHFLRNSLIAKALKQCNWIFDYTNLTL